MTEHELICLDCDWEATVRTQGPPIEASQAAIEHHLTFGHRIERVVPGERDRAANDERP